MTQEQAAREILHQPHRRKATMEEVQLRQEEMLLVLEVEAHLLPELMQHKRYHPVLHQMVVLAQLHQLQAHP
jgi:hypothetical protein